MIEFDIESETYARMKVVGVGGAGGNAVNRMIESGLNGVKFVSVNTDNQALDFSLATDKVQIGKMLTKGLGAGANPDVGQKAAEEDIESLKTAVNDADMVFITCGMGGGTGTGASPVVAAVARETGALTVGIVTKPFFFEGDQRIAQAERGIEELRNQVDTLLVIPNDKLLSITTENTSLLDAFTMADEVLCNATRGISDLITETGVVNLDFADVKSVMKNGGDAIMGTGYGKGENGAEEAARMAINSPLLDSVSVKGATGILVNITGSQSLALRQVSKAATIVNKEAGPGAHVFLGAVINDEMKGDEIRITVIATGFNAVKPRREEKVEEKKEINFRELLSDEPTEVRLEKKEPAPEEKEEEIFLESGSIRTFNTDRFRIPTFVRKQMD